MEHCPGQNTALDRRFRPRCRRADRAQLLSRKKNIYSRLSHRLLLKLLKMALGRKCLNCYLKMDNWLMRHHPRPR